MRSRLLAVLLAVMLLPAAAFGEEEGGMLQFKPSGNLSSVQRGARDFMNYCSGCHSLKYLRYERMAADLKIPTDILKKNLMFTSGKVGDTIVTAMAPGDASSWFGQAPPDLTLEAEYRGADWIYNYLLNFYVDPAKDSTGVNNVVFPSVAMPDVLWSLQGWQVPVKNEKGEVTGVKSAGGGSMSEEEFQTFVADLTNFLNYAAAPDKAHRQVVGICVIVYLLFFTGLCYLLKKEYWRDVPHDDHHH